MKHSTRILAYSALALIVMLAAFGAITFDSSNVAYAQTGTVPAAPTLTATSSGPNSITITWDAVPSAVSYELWSWDNDDGWQRLDGGADDPPVLLTGTSFVHTGLMSGKTYYYQMQAFDSDGDPSGWSDRVNEVAGDAPDAPVLTPAAGYEQITVSWPAVTDAVSYELHAWDGAWKQLPDEGVNITDTSYTHTGLTAGTTIYYQGRSVNAGGTMSAWSVQVNATVLSAPTTGAPQSLTAAASGNGEVTLTWTAPADDGGLGIDGYHYQYGETGNLGDDWKDAGDVLTVTISNLTNGAAYDFEVRAFNSGGNGPAAMVSAMPVGGSGALQSLAAVATSHNMVTLTWTAPSDTGGLAITGYDYRSYETGGTPPDTWEDAGNVLTVDVTGLTKNTDYTFEVRAMNSAGSGPAATATATTLREPDAPATLTAASGNGQVTLTWIAPANDGGLAVTSYEYRSYETGGTAPDTWKDAGDVLTVDITGLTNRTEYTFEVRAVNLAGPGAVASATQTPSSKPGPVQNLTATPGHGEVILSWDEPSDNGGSAIVRYEIEKYDASTTNWNRIASKADLSHRDAATAGATTEYRVRAFNANANLPSDWANVSGVALSLRGPSEPQNLKATPGNGSIIYTWEAPASTGGQGIQKYEYLHFAGTTRPNPENWNSVGSNTTVTLINLNAALEEELAYTFEVRAVNSIGEGSVARLTAQEAATAPSTPRIFSATALGPTSILLSWGPPVNNGGRNVDGYQFQFKTDAEGSEWGDGEPQGDDFLAPSPATNVTFTHEDLVAGTTYYYRLRAVNERSPVAPTEEGADDPRVWPAEANARTHSTEPDPPENVVVAFEDGRLKLTWTAPPANGEEITNYKIRWMMGDDTDFPPANVIELLGSAREYIVVGPTPAPDWEFEILAENSEGDSAYADSTPQVIVVPAPIQQIASGNAMLDADVNQTTGVATIYMAYVSRRGQRTETPCIPSPATTSSMWRWMTTKPLTGSRTMSVSKNIAAQTLMQEITGALPGDSDLYVRLRNVSTVGTKSDWRTLGLENVNARAADHPVLDATIIGQNVLLSWEAPQNNGTRYHGLRAPVQERRR